MSWVTVVWSMAAAACLTLSAVHVSVALRQRSLPSAFFAASGFSVAAVAAFEFALMRVDTPESYGQLGRWFHVPVFLLVVSFVLFVRTFLNAGRLWLAAAAIATRGAALVINFLHDPNLNFREISGIRHIRFLGEEISVPVGTISPWTRLGELSSVFVLAFLLDAAVTVWRRGQSRRAAIVGGGMTLFVLAAAGHGILIHARVVALPYMVSIAYLAIVAVMGYELMRDVARANELARELQAKERALRESDRRLALAAGAAQMGFWSWDVGSDEVWLSARARETRGYRELEPIDRSRLFAAVHPEDREPLRQALDAAAAAGGEFDREYRIRRPDGEERWISLYATAGRDPDDGRMRVQGASIDVTARKLADIEAGRRQTELAHLSRVASLGELSGSLAHELNQPLTAILSNAQAALGFLSQENPNLGEVREILSDIVGENRRAGEVIRRLRLLMRKGEVELESVDLRPLIDDVLKLLRSDLISHGVTVTTDVPELPRVRGDEIQIEQVLVNLVTNACDAMEGSAASARVVGLSASRDGDATVRVSVADMGCGLPIEDLERIFEPFVTTKAQGMGLGLTVCRTIIGAHGGRLWAVNNDGGGATFHFTLPVFEAR